MRPASWFVLALYAVVLLPALADFRAVMGDEAAYADPALRWCDGLGFTSIAWEQSPTRLWASNCPLYALVVAGWVKSTGLDSLWGLRALSLLLYLVGVALWILGCRRAGWFKSSLQELGFIGLLFASLYATAPSQYVRPESLGVAVLGFALWGQTVADARLNALAAAVAGFLAVLAGFQFVAALVVFGCAWFLLAEEKPWKPLFLCCLGGVAGLAALFAVYSRAGVLGIFVEATFGSSGNRVAQWHGWRDPMLWAGSAFLFAGLVSGLWPIREKRRAIAGLLCGPGLAAVLFALSKFPQYYACLAVLPVCTAVAAVFPSLAGKLRPAAIAFLAIAGMAGFPLSALMNWNAMPARRHHELQDWVHFALRGSGAAFVDPSVYFAARGSGANIYTQFVLKSLSPGEADGIDAVVLSPGHPLPYLQPQTVLDRLGGSWRQTGAYPPDGVSPLRLPMLGFLSRFSNAPPYRFQVWRRSPVSSPAG